MIKLESHDQREYMQEPLKFKTHKTSKRIRLPDRIRFEVPYPLDIPNLVHVDRLSKEKWFTPMQYHDYFEITYIAEGSAWFILDGTLLHARRGEMFITKPAEIHCGGAAGESPFIIYGVGFHFEQMRELELPFYQLRGSRIVEDSDETYRRCFERLMAELESQGDYTGVMTRTYLMQMLVSVLRNCERTGKKQWKQELIVISDPVKEAIHLIHSEGLGNMTVSEVAEKVNRSRSHLDREFKRFMGVSPGEYMRLIRLDRAKHLLKHTSDTITMLADILQFETSQAFCMFFKRQTGLYPQEYRNRHGYGLQQMDEEKCE